jgi:hypothetical protein
MGDNKLTDSTFLTAYSLLSWNYRLWEFAASSSLVMLENDRNFVNINDEPDLWTAAFHGFLDVFVSIVMGAYASRWIELNSRLSGLTLSLLFQRFFWFVGTSCSLFVLNYHLISLPGSLPIISSLFAFANLSTLVWTMSFERDCLLVISNGNEEFISSANAKMMRMDLASTLGAPFLWSVIQNNFSLYNDQIIALLIITTLSTIVEIGLAYRLYSKYPALWIKKNPVLKMKPISFVEDFMLLFKHLDVFACIFCDFLLRVSIIDICPLMVSYLLLNEFDSAHIGLLKGMITVSGILSTFILPRFMKTYNDDIFLIILNLAMHGAGSIVCYIIVTGDNSLSQLSPAVSFILLASLSICGFSSWGFDLVQRQLILKAVDEESSTRIYSISQIFLSLAYLVQYGITMLVHEDDQFAALIRSSTIVSAVSSVVFYLFIRRHKLKVK